MKKWSIKIKIIFWYTLFFALLIIFDFYFLQSTTTRVLTEQASNTVRDATIEVADMVKVEDDGIYLEEDDDEERFNYYHDGVLFLVYKNNTVSFGTIPNQFDGSSEIRLNQVQSLETNGGYWLVYDIQIEDGYILRGIYDMNSVMNSIRQVIRVAGILSPIIVLIAGIGGYIIIKRSFKPIQEIYQTAAMIKDEEDYSKRISSSDSKDEVYALADMVNQMLDQVEESINREKQFSSNVSHELRTPLTVVQAQTEYLLKKADSTKQKAEIETIIHQISYMENIVNQLLEITRTKQLSDNDMESVDLYELVHYTLDSFVDKMNEKKITYHIEKPEFSTNIFCNQTMMIRVFSNLIANAIKYNKESGKIEIKFVLEKQNIIVFVSDNGSGISKEHLTKIFDAFYRVDEARTQNDSSLGLGLALVKEVVRIHGGDVDVESTLTIGTTFKVVLPQYTSEKKV